MVKTFFLLLVGLLCLNDVYAGVRINELMAINSKTKIDPDNRQYTDWIELYNSGNSIVDLGSCFLTDEKNVPFKWRFPEGTQINPNSYLLIWMDGKDYSANAVHSSFKLRGMGEWIALTDLSGRILDSVSFERQVADNSYGRVGPGNDWYYLSKATPGLANDDTYAYLMAPAPLLSRGSEINGGTFNLTVTPTIPGAAIYYTTDGSVPDENSSRYSGPLTITGTTIFRAIQSADDYTAFWPASASYLFSVTTDLPVISLISDPENLWDDYTGIYVDGLNGITGYCNSDPKNYNRDWERPVTFEYFDREHLLAVHIDAGMKIFGGCSRAQALKSLNIKTDKIYGSNSFSYAFFREKPEMEDIRKIVLRNSGNDFGSTMMRDPMMQALVKEDLGIEGQAYEPAVIYINGAYWGIGNIREKIDGSYIESNYGIPEEEIDMVENYSNIVAGGNTRYLNLYYFIRDNDLSIQANYDYVASKMEIAEFINYFWAQIYFGNTDWPGNNIRFWSKKDESTKWRWILYDTDFGFNLFSSPPNHNTLEFALDEFGTAWPNPSWSTLILRKLMGNEDFAADFLAEAQTSMMTTFSSSRVKAVIDSIQNGIIDEMPSHIARWGSPGSYSNWAYNVDYLRTWAEERPSCLIGFLGEHYGISASYGLDISYPSNEGVVWLNGVQLSGPVSGGSLLKGTRVKVKTQAKRGFRFKEWIVDTRQIETFNFVKSGDNWKYFDQGTRPDGWEQSDFNDDSWASGPSELGYGDGDEKTVISYGNDAGAKYISTYFRHKFTVDDPSALDSLVLAFVRDDGIVIYLNGNELLRDNMPDGTIDNNTLSASGVGGTDESVWTSLELSKDLLITGENTLAAEVHQTGPTSSDISFNLKLTGWIDHGSSSQTITDREVELTIADNIAIRAFYEAYDLIPDLKINEVMASNSGYLADDFGEYDDWIEIKSKNDQVVDMAGMYLSDSKDRLPGFMIPYGYESTKLEALGFKLFWADGEEAQGPLHTGFKISAGGESVILSMYIDGDLYILDSVSFGPMNENKSMGLYQEVWGICEEPTPGEENKGLVDYIGNEEYQLCNLYPNPASTDLFIHLTDHGDEGSVLIRIVNLQGSVVSEKLAPNRSGDIIRMDVSELPAGLYLLSLKNSSSVYSLKLLIVR